MAPKLLTQATRIGHRVLKSMLGPAMPSSAGLFGSHMTFLWKANALECCLKGHSAQSRGPAFSGSIVNHSTLIQADSSHLAELKQGKGMQRFRGENNPS